VELGIDSKGSRVKRGQIDCLFCIVYSVCVQLAEVWGFHAPDLGGG